MHELAPVSPFVALAYLIAGILFILAPVSYTHLTLPTKA